jgi:Ca-activated chloride channel family protein
VTGSKLALARDAIARLVSHDLDSRSEWFFARFSSGVVRTQEWTTDRTAIVQALREVRATGDTALRDAIALTIPLVEEGHLYKKALLVVSDGGETRSLLSLDDVQKAIGSSDVRIYGVGVNADMRTLRRVGDDTGGRTEAVNTAADIQAATARIADELRHQYLLGYSTPAPKDGRRHAIRVQVRGRGLKVRARQGFVSE